MKEIEQQLIKTFEKLTYNKDSRKVFEQILDFIIFCTTTSDETKEDFSNDFNDMIKAKNEIVKGFNPKEMELLQQVITLLGEATTIGNQPAYHDALGDLFMAAISSNNGGRGRNDQHFTPQKVSDLMAEMQGDVSKVQSVCDCCCGSGRMLLSVAKINPNMTFFGSDIDPICVKMCVVNFILNGMNGEVVWGNPLTLEAWKCYQITINPYYQMPMLEIKKGENSVSFPRLAKSNQQSADSGQSIKNAPQPITQEYQQLAFDF